MKTFISGLLYLALVLTNTGCKSLFSSETSRLRSPWTNFAEAQIAFDRIAPNETTLDQLRRLGFDPTTTPNVKVLTYLDLIARFLPNASVRMEDLQPDVRRCIESKDCCHAYELELRITDGKRYGNLMLDLLGFKRQTRTTGWYFKALIIVKDDIVAYKLRSGEPMVERYDKKIKPLGPFQDLEGFLGSVPKSFM